MTREIIDPDGDRLIRCGDIEFLLSPKAVSQAAPQLSGDSIQRLTSEDPRTIRIFLNVAHGRSDEIPSVIDPDDMISLVDFVEKYECNSAITPHAQQWLQMDLEGHAQEDLWKVLRLACAIGSRHHSERICHQLIVSHLGPFHSWAFAVNNFGSMPQETLGMCNHY